MEEEKKKDVAEDAVEAKEEAKASKSAPSSGSGNNKTVAAIVIVAVLILGALEFSGKINIFGGNAAVATVNGEKITQSEFDVRLDQILNSPQAQALDLNDEALMAQIREQVLAEIVNTRILTSAATDAGFTVTDEEVAEEYDAIVERLGGAEILVEELQNGGLTDSEFRENISEQLLIQKYIADNVDESIGVVSDEEIAAFYEQISGQEGVPPLEDIRTQIEGQLASQKEQGAIGELIELLRLEADVVIVE